MTIPSENNRNDFIGNGALDTYSYTFKITSESDIKLAQRDTNDVETILTLNVDYTVTGVGALNGGTIILTAGNLPTDYHLTARRDSDLTQQTDVRNQGEFLPEIHEDTFDHLASVDQTQQSEIDRCVKLSETYPIDVELPGPQADKALMWNSAGDALINVAPGSVALATPADGSVTGPKIYDATRFVFPTLLNLQKGSDVASGAALGLGIDGNYFDITGTDAITSIDTVGIGTQVILHFDGILTFTHHATNLILPGGANITTAAGDHAYMVEYDTGKWRCVYFSGVLNTNKAVIAAGGVQTDEANTIKTKIMDIDDWNMDTVASVNVAHGLTLANIRSVSVLIRDDVGSNVYSLEYDSGFNGLDGTHSLSATNVILARFGGGWFDSSSFDSTSYNRGWITITYIV